MGTRLVEATDSQKRTRDALTASVWAGPLSVPQFLEREALLRAHPFALNSMKTWLWCDDTQVLSSCETFEVPATCGHQRGKAYIIATVFTEPALRGNHHAGAMLEALIECLSRPEVLAFTLFSEVGAKVYERCGFVAQPAHDLVWPATDVAWAESTRSGVEGEWSRGRPATAESTQLVAEERSHRRPTPTNVVWAESGRPGVEGGWSATAESTQLVAEERSHRRPTPTNVESAESARPGVEVERSQDRPATTNVAPAESTRPGVEVERPHDRSAPTNVARAESTRAGAELERSHDRPATTTVERTESTRPGVEVEGHDRSAPTNVEWSERSESPLSAPGEGLQLETTADQSDWHVERERIVARALGRAVPTTHLARHGASRLMVAAAFNLNELHVLWYEFSSTADLDPLFRACAKRAKSLGLAQVRLWESTPLPCPSFATRVSRTDELPMVRSTATKAPWVSITRALWA